MALKNELAGYLTDFGLTRQEAVIYLTLLSRGKMTGYEVSKETGISRSNAYSSLAGLVEKGAACTDEGEVRSYAAVSLKEFTGNVLHHLSEKQEYLLRNQPEPALEDEGYLSVRGRQRVLDKLRFMIISCEKRLYLSAPWKLVSLYEDLLKDCSDRRGIKVVILTDEDHTLGDCVVYAMKNLVDQVHLIADSKELLSGRVLDETSTVCLYSRNADLIEVFKEMMRSEIIILEKKYGVKESVLVSMAKEL